MKRAERESIQLIQLNFGENGAVTGLETVQVRSENINGRLEFVEIPDTTEIHEANLVCLAMGFVGPESSSLVKEL